MGYLRFRYLGFIAIFLVLLTAFSCSEEGEDSPILVFLTPEDLQVNVNSNDHFFVTINSQTRSGTSLRLIVQTVDILYGVKPVLDSTFKTKKINYLLDFVVPAYPDSTESLMIFSLLNEAGDQIQIAKRLYINKGSTSLTEASGNIIYSTISSKPSGYSLPKLTPVYLADSLTQSIDFVDASELTNNPDKILSRTLISRTNLQFVKFNGFNYAQANSITINNAYKGGIKLSKASGLSDGDILIIGKGNDAIGAIQIFSITDLEGSENDKYSFSVKRID